VKPCLIATPYNNTTKAMEGLECDAAAAYNPSGSKKVN